MSEPTNADLLDILQRIEARLSTLTTVPDIPADVRETVQARISAKLRGWYTSKEFAAVIGRHPQWVSDRCAAGVIRPLPGGKPWRIPLAAEREWNGP